MVLLDRQRFPRDKTCGDLVGTEAVATLQTLGLGATLDGALPLAGAVVHGPRGEWAGGRGGTLRRPDACDARVIPRHTFDARLLRAAQSAGAAFAVATVRGAVRNASGRIAGVRTDAGDVRAPVTIAADGWGSQIARAAGCARKRSGATALVVRAYASGIAELGRCMHFFINPAGDGYGWVFPLGKGQANVGLGFIRGEGGAPDVARAFERFTQSRHSLAAPWFAAADVSEPAAWPIPLGWSNGPRAAPGVFVAGDAAALASPLSGSGIHHALASGAYAARSAIRVLGGDESAWRAYDAAIAQRFALRLRAERIVHDVAGRPAVAGAWLRLAAALPGANGALSRALLALG